VLSQISVLRNISLIIFPRVQLRVYVLQSRLGPTSKWSICSSRLRTQLKIRAVKVYVLGRLGPSCKSVYVPIDSPQDPAFQYEYMPWEPLSTQLFADKKYSIINTEQLSHTSITPQTLCSYTCRYIKYLNIYIYIYKTQSVRTLMKRTFDQTCVALGRPGMKQLPVSTC
jgi:hypothetical protein